MSNTVPLRAYTRIHKIVEQIPPGRVSTYGRIAALVGNCTPRMVGYALAALPANSPVPWQRVINAQGKISLRAGSGDNNRQRILLEAEGIRFDGGERVNLKKYGWDGPPLAWLLENGFDPTPSWSA